MAAPSDSLIEPQVRLPVMDTYLTLQGEGVHTGRIAYFIRLAGCSVGCHWCDVKESWDASAHPAVDIDKICQKARQSKAPRAVITGGEPLHYNLDALSKALQALGLATHLETSGAYPLTGYWDWICFSPKKRKKAHTSVQAAASELKIIIYNFSDFRFAEEQAAEVHPKCRLLLQPEWSRRQKMLPHIIHYLNTQTQWQLSLQTHKYIGLP